MPKRFTEARYLAFNHGLAGVPDEFYFVVHRPASNVDEVLRVADCFVEVGPSASRLEAASL